MNKDAIKSALAAITTDNFLDNTKALLATLGYKSDKTEDLFGSVDEFIDDYDAPNPNTKTEQEFRNHVKSVQFIFQFTSDEIEDDPQQTKLFEAATFDKGNNQSFIFCTVELKDNDYSRTKYAEFTREINKRLIAPTVVFFRTAAHLTIAFADRRPSKTQQEYDVLEQVTLIKDIRLNNPHRAHLDILSELSLEACVKWIDEKKKQKNFDGLLAAWIAKLDTEELNKEFYRKLFTWFEWAVETATFPTDENRIIKAEEHIIRLITRLLFIWFIKENGLVAEELFNRHDVLELLKEDDLDSGDSYYRAVLQNLFFATLNTEIDKRTFSTGGNANHRNFSRYRYKKQMQDPDKLLSLFAQTPFINGGLFDCLDSFKATGDGGYRIDCFSDKHYDRLSIPNNLFFDENRGLIPLLEHYKFTVEENTPIDQEVALDPELLGRVFENLLAAINPETGETARKMTGSYYTPRAIVDYMVEEALVATLSQKCQPTDGNTVLWDERLRYLFDYAKVCDDASEWFDDKETDAIVKTISELKILDPAVGSGAFPMGVLHKLTLALRRLDPDNNRWEALQKDLAGKRAADAFNTQDQQERDAELTEISDTFERYRDSDFGRKLYLIQNSIFGVDIQPIACQIAKLRFFISLAIEQEPDRNAENFGIKPLPNLETRFVAANTLIGIDLSETKGLFQDDTVQQLLKEIDGIRERFFLANNRGKKRKLEEQEETRRIQLENELERQRTEWIENRQAEIEAKIAPLPNPEQREQLREKEQKTFAAQKKVFDADFENARKIAQWKPYDQNAKTDWFEPEWMFGVTGGIDVVIGNPPYVRQEKIKHLKPTFKERYTCYTGTADLYVYFYERGLQLLNTNGIHTFICSNSWLDVNYGAPLQEHLLENTASVVICHSETKREFESADINTIVSIIQKGTPDTDSHICFITFKTFIGDPDSENRQERTRTYTELKREGTREDKYTGDKWGGKYLRAPDIYWTLLEKGKDKLVRLGDIAEVRRGFTTGANEFFYLNAERIQEWGIESEYLKPVIKSPRECKSIHVDPSQLQFKLFMCHADRAALAGTAALDYIKWGESAGYHQRPSCKTRARWWDLGQREMPSLSFNYLISSTARTLYAPDGCYTSDNFQEIHADSGLILPLCASLNSSLFQLMVNMAGRSNFGGGLLKIQTYEVSELLCLDPKTLAFEDETIFASTAWEMLDPTDDRRALDAIIFDALNLTQVERDGVYEAVVNLVEARLRKARSLKGK